MTDRLFDKVMVFTDSHYGRSGGSLIALQDNIGFLMWAIDRAKSWGANKCIFMGDWFDTRASIGVITLNYALDGLDMLNNAFDVTHFLVGNHDTPYRNNRTKSSVEVARNLSNINIIRNPCELDGVTFLPWLVEDEYKQVKDLKTRYAFGHLEMGGFKMNSQVILPDSDHLIKPDQFTGVSEIYTGHFHARQTQRFKNSQITYMGSALCHDFSDVNDDDRGIMLLQYGKDPIFEAWPEQPTFRTAKLSAILDNPNVILKPKMTLSITVDVPLMENEANDIREALISEYGLRRVELKNDHTDSAENHEIEGDIERKTVDQIVIEGLQHVESTGLSSDRLVDIYRKSMDRAAGNG